MCTYFNVTMIQCTVWSKKLVYMYMYILVTMHPMTSLQRQNGNLGTHCTCRSNTSFIETILTLNIFVVLVNFFKKVYLTMRSQSVFKRKL